MNAVWKPKLQVYAVYGVSGGEAIMVDQPHDDSTLEECNVQRDSTLHLVLNLRGLPVLCVPARSFVLAMSVVHCI